MPSMGGMMDCMKVKVRDGCRGGSEQFTWNSIKDQEFKDREQYLGVSTKVGLMGKFGRYNLNDWYQKKRETAESIDSERKSVQAYEDELMQEALGLKPKKLLLAKKQLSEEEIKEILNKDKKPDKSGFVEMGAQKKITRGANGEEIAASADQWVADAARDAPIRGLGFADHRTAKLEAIKAATLGTESQLEGKGASLPSAAAIRAKYMPEDVKEESMLEVKEEVKQEVKEEPVEPKTEKSKSERKAEKKEKKRRKKEEKKLKKQEKKEKKALKKERKAAKDEDKRAKLAKQTRRTGKRSASGSSSSDSSSS